jgi:ABC-2 type transport system ATP-binding protein
VRIRSPHMDVLVATLDGAGAAVTLEDDGSASVRGLDAAAIGDLAANVHAVLHELSPQSASLEEAYMELTEDSIEYHGAGTVAAPAGGNR